MRGRWRTQREMMRVASRQIDRERERGTNGIGEQRGREGEERGLTRDFMNARLQHGSSGKIRAFCTHLIPPPQGLPRVSVPRLSSRRKRYIATKSRQRFPGHAATPSPRHSRSDRLTPKMQLLCHRTEASLIFER